jgi:hypothetical protein
MHVTKAGRHRQDLTGRRFGKLVVLEISEIAETRQKWLCLCECGNSSLVRGEYLRSGETRSCGCMRRSHGMRNTKESGIWRSMIQRCHNPNDKAFPKYGGRGIEVCDRWRTSFVNFISDIGRRPSPDHSVDRIDNNGNYEPENCRWATRKQQSRNQRKTPIVTYMGETKPLCDWADECGIDRKTLYLRLKRGWGIEKMLSTKPRLTKRPG